MIYTHHRRVCRHDKVWVFKNVFIKGYISMLFSIDVFLELWMYIVLCTLGAINHFPVRVQNVDGICTPKKRNILLQFQVGIKIHHTGIMNLQQHIFFELVTISIDRILFWDEIMKRPRVRSKYTQRMVQNEETLRASVLLNTPNPENAKRIWKNVISCN